MGVVGFVSDDPENPGLEDPFPFPGDEGGGMNVGRIGFPGLLPGGSPLLDGGLGIPHVVKVPDEEELNWLEIDPFPFVEKKEKAVEEKSVLVETDDFGRE